MTPEFAEPVRATERMVLAWRQTSFRRRTWFAVTLAAIFVLHAALLAVFLWHDDPAMPAAAEETPVEVVAQMPEPPPPPKQPAAPSQPTPPQPPEKPATSAPRAQNDETIDRETGESESRAPKLAAASPPKAPKAPEAPPQPRTTEAKLEPQPEPAQAQPAKADPTKSDPAKPDAPAADKAEAKPDDSKPLDPTPDKAAAPADDASDAEALDKAADKAAADKAPPEPPRRPAALAAKPPPRPPERPTKLALARTPTSARAAPTAIDQLAGNSDLPDFVFAKPQRKPTKYRGGTEDNRYLAVVFAMITQDQEPIALPDGDWQVAVNFQVDGHGSLVGIELAHSSGYPPLDAVALEAVRRAAPFPPPPSGGLTGMTVRMNGALARAAQRDAAAARDAALLRGR